MNAATKFFVCLLCRVFLGAGQANAQTADQPTVVSYTLLDGSYLVDECLICGRPTIQQPLRGTFDLVLVQDAGSVIKYEVRNIDFTASPAWAGEVHITGNGTYERFEEFALLQSMELTTLVKDANGSRPAHFEEDNRSVEVPFPLIKIRLTQTDGTLLQTYSLELFAAPVREIWFSTAKPLTSTNRTSPPNEISAGDLLSNRGRVVKRNSELVGRLGVMPIVPDLGLDAVQVTRRSEILFSITRNVWSETLGQIQHGDLLSNRGAIVKRNQALLAAFFGTTAARPDAGLDAAQVLANGEILFSIQSDVVVSSSLKLSRGDLLSDKGHVVKTNRELLANFHPTVTNHDYGLDALHILPSGEIWFSVEEAFTDDWLGTVQAGDLLSDRGHHVFSNQQLVAAFAPSDPSLDYGLDALFVVTDTKPLKPSPRFVAFTRNRASGLNHLEWDGDGDVFQVEHAPGLSGPWQACSPIVPDLSFDDTCDPALGGSGFYRVRQW